MSVLWRPQGCSFFLTATPASIHRAQMFHSQFPSWKHMQLQRKRGTFDSGGYRPQMGQKAGPPWNSCFFIKDFIYNSEEEEWCYSDCYRYNRTCLYFLDPFFLHHGESVELLQVNLAYLPWKDMRRRGRKGSRRRWYEEGLDALSDWTKSTAVWAMTTINSVHST